MANDIKLEVLTFGIRKIRDEREKTSYLPLNDIDDKDVYKLFADYLANIEDELEINEGQQRALSLRDQSLKTASVKRTYRGIFEGGHYGYESELENIKTRAKKKKDVDDVDKIPFYFLIYVPKELNVGFIMLQRLALMVSRQFLRIVFPVTSEKHYRDS